MAVGAVLALNFIPTLQTPWATSYDGETHLFFASHYARGWFNPWEERWFGGFFVYSYPPLAHQVIGLIGFVSDVEWGYRVVQLATLAGLPIALWLLTREVLGAGPAGWAALLGSAISGVYLLLYTFGQLPTVMAVVLMLVAGSFLLRYWKRGKTVNLLTWGGFAAAALSTHLLSIVGLPLLGLTLLTQQWLGTSSGLSMGVRAIPLRRILISAGTVGLAGSLVLLPFFWWLLTQSLPQAEIPHPTRENIFSRLPWRDLFFTGIWGAGLAFFPLVLWSCFREKRLWPWFGLVVLLGVLGLGTLTPLPRLLFPGWYNWLTYERFTLWAAILITIPVSFWFEKVKSRGLIALCLALQIILAGWWAIYPSRKMDTLQTPMLDDWSLKATVNFLESDDRPTWYYITVGLGESQFARLSRMTNRAATIDGFYFTARRSAFLRESGAGLLDASFWWPGRPELFRKVINNPEQFGVKWGVSVSQQADRLFSDAGWETAKAFQAGNSSRNFVLIWQAPDSAQVPRREMLESRPSGPSGLQYMWGILPILSLITGIVGVLRSKAFTER